MTLGLTPTPSLYLCAAEALPHLAGWQEVWSWALAHPGRKDLLPGSMQAGSGHLDEAVPGQAPRTGLPPGSRLRPSASCPAGVLWGRWGALPRVCHEGCGLGCPGKVGAVCPSAEALLLQLGLLGRGCDLETAPVFLGSSAFHGLLLSCPSGTIGGGSGFPKMFSAGAPSRRPAPFPGGAQAGREPGSGEPEKVPQLSWALLEPPGWHPAWPGAPSAHTGCLPIGRLGLNA